VLGNNLKLLIAFLAVLSRRLPSSMWKFKGASLNYQMRKRLCAQRRGLLFANKN